MKSLSLIKNVTLFVLVGIGVSSAKLKLLVPQARISVEIPESWSLASLNKIENCTDSLSQKLTFFYCQTWQGTPVLLGREAQNSRPELNVVAYDVNTQTSLASFAEQKLTSSQQKFENQQALLDQEKVVLNLPGAVVYKSEFVNLSQNKMTRYALFYRKENRIIEVRAQVASAYFSNFQPDFWAMMKSLKTMASNVPSSKLVPYRIRSLTKIQENPQEYALELSLIEKRKTILSWYKEKNMKKLRKNFVESDLMQKLNESDLVDMNLSEASFGEVTHFIYSRGLVILRSTKTVQGKQGLDVMYFALENGEWKANLVSDYHAENDKFDDKILQNRLPLMDSN